MNDLLREKKASLTRCAALAVLVSLVLVALCAFTPSRAYAEVNVGDGNYSVGSTLQSGPDGVVLKDKAHLYVEKKQLTATLTWTSGDVTEMVVDGVTYTGKKTSEGVEFEMPLPNTQDLKCQVKVNGELKDCVIAFKGVEAIDADQSWIIPLGIGMVILALTPVLFMAFGNRNADKAYVRKLQQDQKKSRKKR